MPSRPPPAAFAREVVRRTLGGSGAMDRLDEALDRAVTDAGQLEASVRWRGGESASAHGGRLMIEAVPFEVVSALAEALGVVLPPLAGHLAELGRAEQLPLIAGCDASS